MMRCMVRYKRLGKNGPEVSVIGYGGWSIGKEGWGNVSEKEAARTVELALEAGINLFDTAPIYGRGHSEELLGELLAPRRKQVIIATKCGLTWESGGKVYHDLSPGAIRREVEESLGRLKSDYLDLYQIHWPDSDTPLEESFAELNRLHEEGLIRYIGVSNFSAPQLKEACTLGDVVSLQAKYNLLEREAEAELLPLCKEMGLGFIAYSPLAQGLLTGAIGADYRLSKRDIRKFNPLFSDKELFHQQLDFIGSGEGPILKRALSFLFENEGVTSSIIGVTRVKHFKENLQIFKDLAGD